MASMRDLKRRIRSNKNIQQITRAMKMMAATKLRKAQVRVVAARPYADKIAGVIARLASGADREDQPLLAEREVKKVGYVLITADRGMCGGYNASLIRLAQEQLQAQKSPAAFIAVGRKGRDYFRRRQCEIACSFTDLGDEPDLFQARELARHIIDLYLAGTVDEVTLIYSRFQSAIRQVPTTRRLLPVPPPEGDDGAGDDYIYEPSPAAVLSALLPRYVETQVYRALLEAKASEHGARMTAMDSATENASEMIAKLTLTFNRARQASITKEILEVVSGADALK